MMAGLFGRMLDRYEIVTLLGAGGMGSVDRARDIQLKRDVAIKVISDGAEADPGRVKRFDREIRTVARLSHPNILEIHDFGHVDGISYAVMELLKGRNLRQLVRKRQLPIDRALEIGISVADGLGAAHHQGVLHRDIKPENIFVTSDGGVKILDFGLARDVTCSEPTAETASFESSLTTPGTVVGTTAYMSPEQVRGKKLDARSDIFSLGCVLYEMFSGTHPFRRETRVDTISAILNDEPKSISETRTDLPPAVEVIIGRCLNKDSEQRFDSARDVAYALGAMSQSQTGQQAVVKDTVPLPKSAFRALAVVAVAAVVAVGAILGVKSRLPPDLPSERRIAVLRFQTDQGAGDLTYFADGLRDTVVEGLTLLEQSAEGFGWTVPPDGLRLGPDRMAELQRTYNLTVAILGTVGREDDQLTLRLEAVDPRTGRRLRSSVIEDGLGNFSSFQSEPVARIAEMWNSRWTTPHGGVCRTVRPT